MYLGEICHKGKSYHGQQEAIITQAQWDAVQAVLADDRRDRERDTKNRGRTDALLRGLLFTTSGERLQPTFTNKKGKTYRYYVACRNQKYGAGASAFGSLPAEHIEDLVLTQVQQALSAPTIVQAVWDQVQANIDRLTEPEVILPMPQLGKFWPSCFQLNSIDWYICRLSE